MSQDLLDKQVEILERRYGGLRARRAAVTIQKAFRRRQLLKKFSSITAMAKAADSNARRLQDGDHLLVNGKYYIASYFKIFSPLNFQVLDVSHNFTISTQNTWLANVIFWQDIKDATSSNAGLCP